jgi:parvulin-like peptidyl-prolyl isomerase
MLELLFCLGTCLPAGSLLVAPQHLEAEKPPLASVRRIVLDHAGVEGSNSGRSREDALELARGLSARIRAGSPFAPLAEQFSAAPERRSGGELGTFVPGVLAPPIDAFLFGAKDDEVSAPIEFPTGICVLQRVPTHAAVLRIQVLGDAERRAKRAQEVSRRLAAGEDFGKVARELSDDTISAARGGQFAIFERGASDTLLKRAAFELDLGQVFGPLDLEPLGLNWIRRVALSDVDPLLREDPFVRLSAILFRFDTAQGADPRKTPDEQAARKEADLVLEALDAGSDFAKLAREHTDDPGGAERGGDLGWIHRPTPGLSDAIRTAALLPPGGRTPVLRVPAGWVILQRDR